MASPFPGMDPFLEDPAIFPDLHDSLIKELRDGLNARLPAPYYAGIASRAWIEVSHRPIGPDVNVLRPKVQGNGGLVQGGGGIAVSVVQAEAVVVNLPNEEMRETFLEIYAQAGGEQIITTVELLSPANKTPGAHGRELYQKRQREILESQVHLVEIDLLRGGTHATAVPLDWATKRAGPFDYHVCVHRFDRFFDYFIYPIRLREQLPALAIPLRPGDPEIRLELQPLLNRCYETGLYERRVHYHQPVPPPPLTAEHAAWVKQLLRDRGLRA